MPSIYSLWIVGRNGGLLYSRDFLPLPDLDFNDKLRLASSWFGMCGIADQLDPTGPPGSNADGSSFSVGGAQGTGGIRLMQASTFDLHSFQTLTGSIFMLVTSPHVAEAPELLRGSVYTLYADYIQKNPFHQTDQVMKSEAFDARLAQLMRDFNARVNAP